MATGTAVTKKKEAALAEADALEVMFADAQDTGSDFNADDLAIPRITICQALSPQRKKSDPAYIEGLEEGQIFNTVLGTIYGLTARVVPISYRKVWNIWRRKKEGGGFCGTFHDPQEAERECAEDCDVFDTAEYFVLVETPEGGWDKASLSFKMTGMKVSRRWNSQIEQRKVTMKGDGRVFTPPMFAQVYALSSVEAQNDKGSWGAFAVAPAGLVTDLDNGGDVYTAAKAFRAMCEGGLARASYEEAEIVEGVVEEEEDNNLPF